MIEIQNDVAPYDINYGDEWEKEIKNNDSDIGWHINSINAPQAWKFCDEHKDIINPVRIGVIDYTFDTNHEDLINCVVNDFYDDFTGEKKKYLSGELEYGNYAHGTHVFGTFASDTGNSSGICGVYPYGRGNSYLAAWGIDKYKENLQSIVKWKCYLSELILRNVKIINNSYGNGSYNREALSDQMGDFLNRLLKAGKDFVIVASAGNSSDHKNGVWNEAKYNSRYNLIDGDKYPEIHDRIIVVGSVDKDK